MVLRDFATVVEAAVAQRKVRGPALVFSLSCDSLHTGYSRENTSISNAPPIGAILMDEIGAGSWVS